MSGLLLSERGKGPRPTTLWKRSGNTLLNMLGRLMVWQLAVIP